MKTVLMTISPEALLEGPRGRHLCLAVAHRLHQPVWSTWLESAWHPSDVALRAGLIAALAEVDLTPLQAWTVPESFTGAVGDSVDRAMYWQPPVDEDVVAAAPEVTDALRPIAAAISIAPGAQWWDMPIDIERQRYTSLHASDIPVEPPDLGAAAGKLAEWKQRTIADDQRAKRERPADPAAPYGGSWWSTPIGVGLLRTSRALQQAGATQLLWEEDGLGQDEATVWTAQILGRPRIYEIHRPTDWIDLVRRYPLDVTWGRRHEWFKVTGRDGTWIIPDWEAVSRDWDAVHLTVLGYLTTATRPLLANERAATMLAGWNPDETFWLSDALAISSTRPERWTMTEGSGTADVRWQQRTA